MVYYFFHSYKKRIIFCTFWARLHIFMLSRYTNVCVHFNRERERVEGQRAARGLQSAPPRPPKQQQQDTESLYKEQKIQTMVHMRNLKVGTCPVCVCVWVAGWHSNSISSLTYHTCMFKCLQRHFSGWYSVVLDQRLRMGKTMALYDWKRKLRAWRAWRAVVWAEQKQREVVRTEQELRAENRREPKRQYFLSIFLADTH